MTSLLTPTKSKVDYANTLLFLSKNPSSFACSFWLASAPMNTVLSGTLGSNGTFLNSPSTSMIFLYSTGGSTLCWSNCSHRKCTILWPGTKPFLMFLASCGLPKTDMCEGHLKFFSQFSSGSQPLESMLCTSFR
jgi:hypothetical protein